MLPQVKDDLRAWRLGRVVTVVDRGFSSAANLDYLRRAGGHFIAGERMRAGTPHVEEVLARQGRYRAVRDNLRVKEIRLEHAPDLRWVLCSNPDEAGRAAAQREAAQERIRAEAVRRREAELAAHPGALLGGRPATIGDPHVTGIAQAASGVSRTRNARR